MKGPKNISGQRFGWLVAVSISGRTKADNAVWLCQCDCGKQAHVISGSLVSGRTKSCGCLVSKQDGLSGSYEYPCWASMINRCYNPNFTSFKYYGARGIKVCERWRNSFLDFIKDMAPRPSGTSLDRINNDGDYCPENCKWSDRRTQRLNNRYSRVISVRGETLREYEWAKKLGVPKSTIASRITRGSTPEMAVMASM